MDSIFKEEYTKLLKYTRHKLGKISHVDAEDVLHEVAFNVFRKIDFESSIENIAAYIYQSIKNKISDIIRKPKRTVSLTSFDDDSGSNVLLETTKNEVESIDEEIERKEMYAQINQALQLLPEDYRHILVATEYDGKTIRELSEEWDIPLGTLLSRRHRALAKLQKTLKYYNIK